jgi:ABC-type Zn uptake system ZnuABC Zn-binding protein ZnuA
MSIGWSIAKRLFWLAGLTAFVCGLGACTPVMSAPAGGSDQGVRDQAPQKGATPQALVAADSLPVLSPVPLQAGTKLRVVATTNIIADVVAHVGGDAIQLTALMPVGADPHSYAATPSDLRALSDADVIFVNGFDLEQEMRPILGTVDSRIAQIAVNTGVQPLAFGNGDNTGQQSADPHAWFNVHNVEIWTTNIRDVLSELDPANAQVYAASAASYTQTLAALDRELRGEVDTLRQANRKLVTDHDDLSYLAAAYGFEVIGSVIPSFSTSASPSAQELAALQDQMKLAGVKAVLVGTTVNPALADQLAQDLGIQVVPIYSDSLSAANGPAPTYVDLMRYDVKAIVQALK